MVTEKDHKSRGVVVKGLEKDASVADVSAVMGEYGKINSVEFQKDPGNGVHHAVVVYESPEMADKAVKTGGVTINGDMKSLAYAKGRKFPHNAYPRVHRRWPSFSNRKIRVTGVPVTASIKEMREFFGTCELSIPFPKKDTEGQLFVMYPDENTRNEKVAELDGKEFCSCQIKVEPLGKERQAKTSNNKS